MVSEISDHLKIVLVGGEEDPTTVFLLAIVSTDCYYQEEQPGCPWLLLLHFSTH